MSHTIMGKSKETVFQTTPPKLSKYLFWNIDTGNLDYESRASFIFERIFTMGMQKDEWEVVRFYGKERIKNEKDVFQKGNSNCCKENYY